MLIANNPKFITVDPVENDNLDTILSSQDPDEFTNPLTMELQDQVGRSQNGWFYVPKKPKSKPELKMQVL